MGFFKDLFGGVTSALTGNPLGVISSVGNMVLGSVGQSNQNATQQQIAQERNELDYKMWQEEKEHNIEMFNMENQANIDMFNMQNQAEIDMWNMNNAYNDPSQQVERLRNAGLNPYLYLQGQSGSAGNSSSAPSAGTLNAGSIAASNRPTPQGYSYSDPWLIAGSQMLDSVSAFSQAHLNDLVARGQAISNTDNEKLFEHNKVLRKNAEERDNIDTQHYNEQKGLEIAILRATKAGMDLDNDTKEYLNSVLPIEKQLDVALKGQELVNKGLEAKKTLNDIFYDLIDHYYSVLQNEKDLEVKDSQIEANEASANASNASAELLQSQKELVDEDVIAKRETNKYNKTYEVARKLAVTTIEEAQLSIEAAQGERNYQEWLQHLSDEDRNDYFTWRMRNEKYGSFVSGSISAGAAIVTKKPK